MLHDVIQGSKEWFKLRELKLTASHAQEIAACGKGLETYTTKIVSEYFSQAEPFSYSNEEMERGKELELEARNIYEIEKGVTVQQIGFIELSEYIGISPDGLIAECGGVEIKVHNDKVYTELAIYNKIDTKYIWQIQMSLLVTRRVWWDFVAYNPNYKRPMLTRRIFPDLKAHERLSEGFKIGVEQIKSKLKSMTEFLEGKN
jgi:hypothetical protein